MLLALLVMISISVSTLCWIASYAYGSFLSGEDGGGGGQPNPLRWVVAVAIPVVMAGWGYARKSLSSSGVAAALVVGILLTVSNFCFSSALLSFFVSASWATRFRSGRKRELESDFREGGQRDWKQVLCNGGVAAELAVLYMFDAGCKEMPVNFGTRYSSSWLLLAVLGALACSSGDTFASEFGAVFGSQNPRLVTTLGRVPRGTNGAVSVPGVLSSIIGGLLVGVAFYLGLLLCVNRQLLLESPSQLPIILMGGLSGFLGSLVDSVLGATVQYSGFDKSKGCIVENPGPDVKYISGVNVLDNHCVNLLSSCIMGFLSPYIAFYLWYWFD